MKIYRALFQIVILAAATTLPRDTTFGQAVNPSPVDPLTGLPAAAPGQLTHEGGMNAGYQTANEVHELISNQKYEEALQSCLAFHDKWKTSASLIPLLNDWVELGRRYPKAKAALIRIRDNDTGEFSRRRGFFALFEEINSINRSVANEDGTYKLYNSFRDKDPGLAKQCYLVVEDSLVSHRDYQWCYDHMGDPQAKFDFIRHTLKLQMDIQERLKVLREDTQRRIAEMHLQRGLTNMPPASPPDTNYRIIAMAKDRFVGKIQQLIEILIATGHRDKAEQIRDQAIAVLDDVRLKSAVTDAQEKINHRALAPNSARQSSGG